VGVVYLASGTLRYLTADGYQPTLIFFIHINMTREEITIWIVNEIEKEDSVFTIKEKEILRQGKPTAEELLKKIGDEELQRLYHSLIERQH